MENRIKYKDLDEIRIKLLKKQNYRCAICTWDLSNQDNKQRHVDHDHSTGYIRGVLCRACNQLEGVLHKKFKRTEHSTRDSDYVLFLHSMADYHNIAPTKWIHPTHKSTDEKKSLRNKRARLKRKKSSIKEKIKRK